MPLTAANEIELYYETVGNPADPAILLIAGLGVQMIDWPPHLIEPLVNAGYFVIQYDNRDIGLSTTFDGAPHDPQVVVDDMVAGRRPNVRYTLDDMAADAAALLDVLAIEAAHLVGNSMGGMIAQTVAINHPDRVLSLTSIMSTTGATDVGQPSPEAMVAILSDADSVIRDEIIEHNVNTARVWASPDLFDEDRLRELFNAGWDRVGGAQGFNGGRHFCAIMASPPRDEALGSVAVPSLVVHGTQDALIGCDGGQRTANCIPGAELLLIDGMGHDLPPAFTPHITKAIVDLVSSSVVPNS